MVLLPGPNGLDLSDRIDQLIKLHDKHGGNIPVSAQPTYQALYGIVRREALRLKVLDGLKVYDELPPEELKSAREWRDIMSALCCVAHEHWETKAKEHRRQQMQKLLQVPQQEPMQTDNTHGDDFHSIRWNGKEYSFTANQAAAVCVLWQNFERGTPDVGDQTLLSAIDSEAPPRKLSDVFRSSPAWNVAIVAGEKKGTHRLAK